MAGDDEILLELTRSAQALSQNDDAIVLHASVAADIVFLWRKQKTRDKRDKMKYEPSFPRFWIFDIKNGIQIWRFIFFWWCLINK